MAEPLPTSGKPPVRVRGTLGLMAALPFLIMLLAAMQYCGMLGPAEMSLGTTLSFATMSAISSGMLVARNGRTMSVSEIR
jgi:hypothetical protein